MHNTKRSKRQFSVKGAAVSAMTSAKHPRLESAQKTKGEKDDVDSAANNEVSYFWPKPPVSVEASRTVYESIHISLKSTHQSKSFIVRRGETVRLFTEEGKYLFIRVNRFVKVDNASSHCSDESNVAIEGDWLLHRTDVENLLGKYATPDCQTFLKDLIDCELILTTKQAIMDITRLVGKVRVLFLRPSLAMPASLPQGEYICRYLLDINARKRKLEWVKLDTLLINTQVTENSDDGEDDFEEDFDETLSSPSNDCDSTTSVEETPKITQEGGGATLRSEIRVGSSYQADVEPFVPGMVSQSRKPVLVHKAHAISDIDLFHFLNRVADLHNEYLQNSMMTLEEPNTPLSYARADNFMQASKGLQRLTGSSMSTSSMLTENPCRLQKECNSDAVLELLILHNYDTAAAFDAIQSDMCRITSGWSKSEREMFDVGFRRNAGSLRAIAKIFSPTKSLKDVIDYFYRFKVPDQFRKFQNKKRRFAVQLVECIETRKHSESQFSNSTLSLSATGNIVDGAGQSSHWSGKSIANLAVVADDRVYSAKQLLLDVKEKFGKERLIEVVAVIQQLQECYDLESRSFLFKLLDDHPEFQRRFLDFLPKHF